MGSAREAARARRPAAVRAEALEAQPVARGPPRRWGSGWGFPVDEQIRGGLRGAEQEAVLVLGRLQHFREDYGVVDRPELSAGLGWWRSRRWGRLLLPRISRRWGWL